VHTPSIQNNALKAEPLTLRVSRNALTDVTLDKWIEYINNGLLRIKVILRGVMRIYSALGHVRIYRVM
jgi:hypothetical protein